MISKLAPNLNLTKTWPILSLLLILFTLITSPILAQAPKQDITTAPQANVYLSVQATTATGSSGPVANGDSITYTIQITASNTITTLVILNTLPENTLDNITCTPTCQYITPTQTVADPFNSNGVIELYSTPQLKWTTSTLNPGQVLQYQINGTVKCQVDGDSFVNSVFLNYLDSGSSASRSNTVSTNVQSSFAYDANSSASSQALWCFGEGEGSYDLDWGDYDQDGDFDLALATLVGSRVYENQNGTLNLIWSDNQQSLSIRWLEAIPGNNTLELAIGGSSSYIYKAQGGSFTQVSQFASSYSLFRLAVADYNNDALPDIAATHIVAASDLPACLVSLYKNDGSGTGTFTLVNISLGGVSNCLLHTSHSDITNTGYGQVQSLAWADYDNDGDPDLAIGGFKNDVEPFIVLRQNQSGSSFAIASSTLTAPSSTGGSVSATSLAWGDYNSDGILDLAAGFKRESGNGQVRIYQSTGSTFSHTIRSTTAYSTPLMVAWGDMNGDGSLDLVITGDDNRLYQGSLLQDPFSTLPPSTINGQAWAMRLIDYDNNGSLDITYVDRDDLGAIYTVYPPFLSTSLTAIDSNWANGVAWGDADGDGYQDLLFAAGTSNGGELFGSTLYYNEENTFSSGSSVALAGFGPRQAAFGDIDGDNNLEIAFATTGQNEIYAPTSPNSPIWQSSDTEVTNNIAWGDVDGDGYLDLLAANNGNNVIYFNNSGTLNQSYDWQDSYPNDNTYSVAWGDYNNDGYLDFAVGNYNTVSRIYCNNGDYTFTSVWSSAVISSSSVAWGDYDNDGDLDLVLGSDGDYNTLYANPTCQNYTCSSPPLSLTCQSSGTTPNQTATWTSSEQYNTTALAWGDWNNDGSLDLAIGNKNQVDQVYTNLNSQPGDTQLYLSWESSEQYATTDLAWGDPDNDGDLDLAISQAGNNYSGYYINNSNTPAHLATDYTQAIPLPYNPPYLSIARPGNTPTAYHYSSAELLSGKSSPTVTVVYQLFDPGNNRNNSSATTASGRVFMATNYDYSLNGGGTWTTATHITTPTTILTATRQGITNTFLWDAVTDSAISDNARFRITLVEYLGSTTTAESYRAGWPQQATFTAISPPFRVEGLQCAKPAGLSISFSPTYPVSNEEITFEATLEQASGLINYTWDFGDGTSTASGPRVAHTYSTSGTYNVTVTVQSIDCSNIKPVIATTTIGIEIELKAYLPIILKN